jgi:hypothetical protein
MVMVLVAVTDVMPRAPGPEGALFSALLLSIVQPAEAFFTMLTFQESPE